MKYEQMGSAITTFAKARHWAIKKLAMGDMIVINAKMDRTKDDLVAISILNDGAFGIIHDNEFNLAPLTLKAPK